MGRAGRVGVVVREEEGDRERAASFRKEGDLLGEGLPGRDFSAPHFSEGF